MPVQNGQKFVYQRDIWHILLTMNTAITIAEQSLGLASWAPWQAANEPLPKMIGNGVDNIDAFKQRVFQQLEAGNIHQAKNMLDQAIRDPGSSGLNDTSLPELKNLHSQVFEADISDELYMANMTRESTATLDAGGGAQPDPLQPETPVIAASGSGQWSSSLNEGAFSKAANGQYNMYGKPERGSIDTMKDPETRGIMPAAGAGHGGQALDAAMLDIPMFGL